MVMLDTLPNPIFLGKAIKYYFTEIDRLRRFSEDDLKRFQDKALRKIVKYAFNVPFYRKKFKEAGVQANEIKSLEDIYKLPIITREDLIRGFPDEIKPVSIQRYRHIVSYTSGTTGKPVSIYTSLDTLIHQLIGYIRVLKEHGADWKKTRISIIVDLSENSIEREYLIGVRSIFRNLFPTKNIQILNMFENTEDTIKKMVDFKPEFIVCVFWLLWRLAILKDKGLGKGIEPNCIISTGTLWTKNMKKRIEEAFGSKVFDMYGAMESGPIAFQCKKGKYHIQADLVYLEIRSDDTKNSQDELGNIILTRLYGKGTPIIRYAGLRDVIALSHEKCNCGLSGRLIKKIYGRIDQSIFLPDNKVLLPTSFYEMIDEVSEKVDLDGIEFFQLIQHDLDKLEILLKVDKKLKNERLLLDKIYTSLKETFRDKVGQDINIEIKEKSHFKLHEPVIISKIDKSNIKRLTYENIL